MPFGGCHKIHSFSACMSECRQCRIGHTKFCSMYMWTRTGTDCHLCVLLCVLYSCLLDLIPVRARTPKIKSLQIASTSRDAAARPSLHACPPPEHNRMRTASARPRSPPPTTSQNPQFIALKDGEHAPTGYSVMVHDGGSARRTTAVQASTVRETVDLCTPPRSGDQRREEQLQTAPSGTTSKKNLAKTMNRKANALFAKEMRDSLAAGRPPTRHVPEEKPDLKARWHSAAKEVAYKVLDLRKDGWKEYSPFDKSRVHRELNDVYKFDPPLDRKSVEKYLAGHLRTSRAVWKAHWLKYGDSQRHHHCPEEAWEKLTKWWPTDKCQTASADMAARRSRVQTKGRMGRTSLLDRMTAEVSHKSGTLFVHGHSFVDSAKTPVVWKRIQKIIPDTH